jgi:outer membrane receptor protein involved in Fe transport
VVTEGSPTGPTALITLGATERGQVRPNPNNDPRIAAYNDLINQCTNTDRATCPSQYIYDDKLSQWRPFRGVALEQDGGDGYNFNPDNYLVTPLTRISLFSLGDTKLGSAARGYFEASYVNRQSDQLLAAEPLGTGGEGVVVSGNSIYNPFGRDFRSVNRRLFEFGGRRFGQDIDTLRVVAGVDGTLPDEAGLLKGWFWDLSFNYGRTQGTSVKQGNIKLTGLRDALGPSRPDPGGVPRCVRDASQPATGGNVIAGCVPMDIFGPPGSIAPDQVANLTFTGTLRGTNQMTAVQFNTAGELFQLFADRPIGLAAGYEYRILSGENIPDPLTVAGETTGNKSDITRGHYYVNEGYGELSIPIVSNLPAAQSVEATVAGRVFNYSNFGTDGTYKFGGRWGVIRDFAVRGTYSTGFRAPSIADLFLGAADAFPRVQDPCRGSAAPASCGINANNGDSRVQINSPLLGNPQLKPEKAKIFTVGVVIEPRMIRNLAITADYYNVAIDQTISRFGAPLIVRNCYFGDPTTSQQYCDLILRDEGTRQISRILNKAQNVGSDKAAGVDVALRYLFPSDFGQFVFVFDGTWLQKYDRTLADGTLVHGKGTYDLGVYPTIKFNSGVRWSYQGFGAGVIARVVGSYKECGQAGSPAGNFVFSGGGLCYPLDSIDATNSRTVGVYSAWDLSASYMFPSPFGRTTVAAGVINAFDRRPVRVYNGFTASSDASSYADGYMGRFFYGRVGHTF